MNKSNRIFIRKTDNNQLFEFVCVTNKDEVVLRQLFGDGSHISLNKDEYENGSYCEIPQYLIPMYVNDKDDDVHDDISKRLGVGYICPFCGGYLAWESDFMTSEVRGMEHCYIRIESDDEIDDIKKHENEYANSNLLSYSDDIKKLESEFNETGYYPTMYVKCGDDYYVADDPVIGIYRCQNCGKSYEVQDCPVSEQSEYPFFN